MAFILLANRSTINVESTVSYYSLFIASFVAFLSARCKLTVLCLK